MNFLKTRFEKLSVRKQLLTGLISICMLTLLTSGIVSFGGIMTLKSDAEDIGNELGDIAIEKTTKTLRENLIDEMQEITLDRASMMGLRFSDDYLWYAERVADQLHRFLQNPENYKLRSEASFYRENDDVITARLLYTRGYDLEANREEIGLLANAVDFMRELVRGDKNVSSIYICSNKGYQIAVDRNGVYSSAEEDIITNVDFRLRPWYKQVLEDKRPVASDLYPDIYTGKPIMTVAAPYYAPNGEIAGTVAVDIPSDKIYELVQHTIKNWTNGFGFVLNSAGHVIVSPHKAGIFKVSFDEYASRTKFYEAEKEGKAYASDSSLLNHENKEIANVAKKMTDGEQGVERINIDGKNYYLSYAPIPNTIGWSVGILRAESEVVESETKTDNIINKVTDDFIDDMNRSVEFLLLAMIGIIAAIMLYVPIVGKKIANNLTEQLNVLTAGVNEISAGNLDKKIELSDNDNLSDNDELKKLANCFNDMTDNLKNYTRRLERVTSERERIATELSAASNIQQSLLPHDFELGRDDIEIYGSMRAAKYVGGDFYDFYFIDKTHLALTMADVSGKGIGAALFMANSKSTLKDSVLMSQGSYDLASAMKFANQKLCQNNDELMFVTVFLAMVDLETGVMTYVNGGHNPPLVYKNDEEKFKWLEVEQNCVLGIMEDVDFVQQETKLGYGDIVYLYTDGVTEAMDEHLNQYGEKRLEDCLNNIDHRCKLSALVKGVDDSLAKFVKSAEQSDDITMLTMRFAVH